MLNAALTLALLAAPPLVTTEGVPLQEDGKEPWEAPFVGVQVDVGAPDGIGASLLITPGRYLRIHGGGLNNGIGSGVRFGATLVAFPTFAFRPIVGVDLGYVFAGTGAWLLPMIEDPTARAALTGVHVAFANAQAGFELGSKHVALTLRAGLSYVSMQAANQDLRTGANSSVTISGIAVTGVIPSARIGMLVCF